MTDLNPYAFQQVVHKKTASVLCLTTVKNEDKLEFSRVLEAIKVALIKLLCFFYAVNAVVKN